MPGVLTRRPAAPEFPKGLTWWNTDRPLSFQDDLKGRVVVLDFWTYCCINCLHLLASLERVEEHFKGQPVVVIGVHSHKFTNEAGSANIREAILRHRVRHPVLVDEGHRVWNQYGVSAWPTLVFIDGEGRVAGSVSGEVQTEEIETAVQALLGEGRQRGLLAEHPPVLRQEPMVPSASGLAYPGKIAADAAGGRLFIADSYHHRVLAVDATGRLLQTIGTGEAGRADGPLARATFNDPQGLAFDAARNLVYVADHGNHLIRRVDLKSGRVETVLGTGAETFDRGGGGRGLAQGLNSPWDLALAGPWLYIAMAGTHQIWRMDLKTLDAEAWVGSGRESIIDGPGYNAALAQPSGLAVAEGWLYFADSEVSALRRARLSDGDVETLVGHGLFDYGDADGAFGRARLQHPLGLTFGASASEIYIADTFNHKIRRADLAARTVTTVAGSGQPGTGRHEGPLELFEPGGLTWLAEWLYIADTNNHRIVALDPVGGGWHELAIREPHLDGDEERLVGGYPVRAEVGREAEALTVEIDPAMVEGFHVNPLAPQTVVIWEPEGEAGSLLAAGDHRVQCTLKSGRYPVETEVPIIRDKQPGGRFIVDMSFASCTDADGGMCKPEVRRWDVTWQRTEEPAEHPLRLVGGAIGVR